ncbi:MAG: enoyl-CoA hydratase/isomerase family protein [Candidatus Hermodarchaeota archaeon]
MDYSEFNDIIYEKEENGICTIILNRPERKNALSKQTFLEIKAVLLDMEQDKNAKVLIITGCNEANAFSSGGYFDLNFFKPQPSDKSTNSIITQINSVKFDKKKDIKFWDFSKPIIAAINGLAIGAGITMILMGADLIYISEDAWIQFNFIKRGIIAQSAMSFILPLYVGFQKAKEILYFGDKITAQEAYEYGMVNKVLSADQLMSYVKDQALKLIPPKGASLSIKLMKKVIHSNFKDIISKTFELEKETNQKLFKTHDFREAIRAFKNKRKPNFKGK